MAENSFPMASAIYRQLPPQKGLQQCITGHLIQLLKQVLSLPKAAQQLAAFHGLQVFSGPLQTALENTAAFLEHNEIY